MKRALSFTLLIVCTLWLYAASNPDFRFRHFTVGDGLLSNSVRAIAQDSKGFIWFGTDEGLNRYDGISIKDYLFEVKDGKSSYISKLYDAFGALWIGTEAGLYRYDYLSSQFQYIDIQTFNGIGISSTIYSIVEDKDENLWISTLGQGVFKYNPSKQLLEQYPLQEHEMSIPTLMVDSENQIWVVLNNVDDVLYRLNKATNRFEIFPLHHSQPDMQSGSLAMYEGTEGYFWLGTWDDGLHKVDPYTGQVSVYLHPSQTDGSMHIHSIMEYAPHQLLIGSDDGLLLFNTITQQHYLYQEEEINPQSLSNRFVYPLVKDREGGVWIGTFYGGVNYIYPSSGQFESYTSSEYYNSVGGSIISAFCEDQQGRIWIGSDDGGLSCFTPKEKSFVRYPSGEGAKMLSYHNVHALCVDDDKLWVGTYTGGINVLDMKNGHVKVYSSDNRHANLDDESAYSIYKDIAGDIWVGTMQGINLYNRTTDSFIRMQEVGVTTLDIDQDRQGLYWFCTQGRGIYQYNSATGTWKNYTYANDEHALCSDHANCILVAEDGSLWAGTSKGLCRYNASADTFEIIPLDIPNQNICGIVEEEHILWLTTSKGIVRYTPGAPTELFMKNDGLLSDQFIPNAILKASDGKIYAGTANGFNAFFPHSIKTNKVVPPVYITGLEIFNRPIPVGDERLPRDLHEMQRIDLSHTDNVFSISFASLSYCMPEKNQYAYTLDGFDKGWNYVTNQHRATYTNLPAGRYTFRVKGTNNHGLWSADEARLEVVIHPPFYLTLPFQLCYLLLICLLVFYAVRLFLKRAEKKHTREISQLNANKEKEVHDAKIQFFTMIAHEIRTPVSLIIGPLEKILSMPLSSTIANDLNIINSNANRLLYLVNQLLDFRKIEQGGMKMKFAPQNLCDLIEAVCKRFEPTITNKDAHLLVDYPDRDFVAIIDGEAVTKLISNLLTNASKYTKDEVRLSCHTMPEQNTFVIRVSDNGIGISPEEKKKIFKPFYQAMDNKPGTGIGLSIVKNVVELHNGTIEVESEVGKGTSFVVTLPACQPDAALQTETNVLNNPVLPGDILVETLSPIKPTTDKQTMLVVDDNEEMLNFLAGCFGGKYNVLTAVDGLQALELLKSNEVALIVSDWMMPRMDGVEFCRAVRADSLISHIPFILLTAKTDLNSKVSGMDCGADAYIEKPFSVQYLKACIKNLIDLRIMLRQRFTHMPMVPLNSVAVNTVDDDFLRRMNAIIEDNFSNPELNVDFLASELCISRSGLFVKIKQLVNVTPGELIQLVRLKKAAALLAERRYKISEVCYMVGFSNPSYFSKCFQKQFGMRPGEFVEQGAVSAQTNEEKP